MAKNQNGFKSKRLSLRGVKFEDAVRAFMQTPKQAPQEKHLGSKRK
jgi:hypothetical protein